MLRQIVPIYPNYVYNINRVDQTYNQIMSMGYFKSANVIFNEQADRDVYKRQLPLLLLILLGGVLYTAGAIVYAKKGFRYHHLVWHLFIDLALLSAGLLLRPALTNLAIYLGCRNTFVR